jgi:isopentenyldiphosphate isomerase
MNRELIIVVDDNDEPIGVKLRDAIDYDVDIYRYSALWITNSKNEVLLAQRSMNKVKDPGVWGPAVSGTVNDGETYDSNIAKEAEEEIGLSGVKFIKSKKLRVTSPRKAFAQWYTLVIDKNINEFTKQDSEVKQIAWVPIQQFLDDYRANPQNYVPAFKEALKFLIK